MAVASSSRQKSSGRSSRRRDPSSDGIEDAQVSQRRIASDDELEDEEEEQPRRSAKGKKGKPTREIGSEAEDDGDDDELEDDGRIDVNNFKDQPLIKTEAGKIKGVASDWANIRTQSQNTVKGLMDNVGTSLADLMPPDEAEKALKELDIFMREILDIEEEMRLHEASVDEIYQSMMTDVPIENAIELYEKGVKTRMKDYRAQTSRQKYAKKEAYKEYLESIYEAQHEGSGAPPITELIPKEDGDISDDDDVEVGGATQNYICPLSLTVFVKPVTSKNCKHTFSEQAIRDFLRRGPQKCPAAGCTQTIASSDIEPNKSLERKVKAYERRKRMQEEDSGDEEVIE